MADAKAYVVTSGSYSDYQIHKVFGSKAAAERCVAILQREQSYSDAEIEEYDLCGDDWKPGKFMSRTSYVNLQGAVTGEEQRVSSDVRDEYKGRSTSRVDEHAEWSRRVYTYGDAERVPQAHADAVAKLRAELMGL